MKSKHIIRNFLILLILLIITFVIYSYLHENNNTNNKIILNTDLNTEYKAYFCPEDDCNIVIYNMLNNANTIDCAIYDITLPWIYDLIKDKNTKIITDNEELIDYAKQFNFVLTDNTNDYMHNKFCILDNNILFIGSLNFTEDAITKQNNNFILTNNKELIKNAKEYFNILLQEKFNLGLTKTNFCASPNNCIDKYIKETKNAKESIKCMLFSFTYDNLTKEFIEKQKQNLNIKIILEKSQNSQYSEYETLKNNNINVIWDQNPSFMHNKFCIFDSNIIITGSMNLSNNGNFNNNESIIIIHNEDLVKQYESYFDKYYSKWS